MREQSGNKIIICNNPNTYIFPPISSSTSRLRHDSSIQVPPIKHYPHQHDHVKTSSFDSVCLRQCCKRKEQAYHRCLAEATAKKNKYTTHQSQPLQPRYSLQRHPQHKPNSQFLKPKRTITYQGSSHSKKKLYRLHNLKTFDPAEIRDQQTSHKVHTPQSRSKFVLNLKQKEKEQKKDQTHRNKTQKRVTKPEDLQKINRDSNQSYINVSLNTPKTGNNRSTKQQYSQKDSDAKTDPSKRYYKYIENYPQKTQPTTTPQRKPLKYEEDSQQKFESSENFQPQSRKDTNTIFHSNKLKFRSTASMFKADSSKISLTQAKHFKLPLTEQQQTQFLLNYIPLDEQFNLQGIIKMSRFGVLVEEGKVYFGLMSNEQKEGKGIFLTEKQHFQGEFLNNQKVQGSEKTKSGLYRGQFSHGKRNGHGQFFWSNGENFQGEWKNGKKQGHGIWKSPKGDYYQGQWKNNKQNGKGVYTHVGGSKYSGYFKDFLKHGRGQEECANGDKYTGQYKNGKPHGYGKYQWISGDIYQGQFVEGSRQGQGSLLKTNGQHYEGGFMSDLKQGRGKEKYVGGQYFEGVFQQGQKVKGKLYSKKGILLEEI